MTSTFCAKNSPDTWPAIATAGVRYRNLAFLLKMGTTFFGSATTILLGLKGYSSFSSHAEDLSAAALISSAAVTLAATWETFFDHRWLWVRFSAGILEGRIYLSQLSEFRGPLTSTGRLPSPALPSMRAARLFRSNRRAL